MLEKDLCAKSLCHRWTFQPISKEALIGSCQRMYFVLQRLGFCLSLSFLLCWPMLCSLSSSTTMMADPISFTSIRIDISVELKKKINVWTVNVINVIHYTLYIIHYTSMLSMLYIDVINVWYVSLIPKLFFKEMVSELLKSWSDISFFQLSCVWTQILAFLRSCGLRSPRHCLLQQWWLILYCLCQW